MVLENPTENADRSFASVSDGAKFWRMRPKFLVAAFCFCSILCCLLGWVASEYCVEQERESLMAVMDQEIEDLASSLIRVKSYEEELKRRGKYLDTVIREAVVLDDQDIDSTLSSRGPNPTENGNEGGIGGGDQKEFHVSKPKVQLFPLQSNLGGSKDDEVLAITEKRSEILKHVPMGYPVIGNSTSTFGMRSDPLSNRWQMHSGTDLAVASNTPVISTADGVVVIAESKNGYGLTVGIDHENGLETLYGHLARIDVEFGQKICRGQQIGLLGSTGRSTGPHLHYEVRVDGIPQNPKKFIDLASFLSMIG